MYALSSKQVLATSYTMVCISGIATLLRFFLRGLRDEYLRLEDVFMLFAFVAFNILATITIVMIPVAYNIIDVGEGLTPDYVGLYDDEVYQLKVMFASNILFPLVLWSVKLSLLSLSRRLFHQQPEWMRAWWVVLGVVVLTYFGALVTTFSSCTTIPDYFKPGGCNTERDIRAQAALLYYVVVAEILTDILIMILPIIFLHGARRKRLSSLTRSTYFRTAGIFSVAAVCIITALCRGVTIGTRMWVDTPTLPWIAIWEMVEGGTAIVVGCLPAYAVYVIQAKNPTTQRSYENRQSLGHHGEVHNFVTTKIGGSSRQKGNSTCKDDYLMHGGIFRSDNITFEEERR